jgi:hypothetical protein
MKPDDAIVCNLKTIYNQTQCKQIFENFSFRE